MDSLDEFPYKHILIAMSVFNILMGWVFSWNIFYKKIDASYIYPDENAFWLEFMKATTVIVIVTTTTANV